LLELRTISCIGIALLFKRRLDGLIEEFLLLGLVPEALLHSLLLRSIKIGIRCLQSLGDCALLLLVSLTLILMPASQHCLPLMVMALTAVAAIPSVGPSFVAESLNVEVGTATTTERGLRGSLLPNQLLWTRSQQLVPVPCSHWRAVPILVDIFRRQVWCG
jgi:hypothetical protein